MPDYSLEEAYGNEGFRFICGVDEAGRGPLSGPVVAAACILPFGLSIEGLNDSKKLSAKKREALFDTICEKAVAYAIASASAQEIDEINILNATMLAMNRAVSSLSVSADLALVDGNVSRGFSIPTVTVVKGDSISASIAAASILAKVTRDRICMEDDKRYPEYQFAKHKGYSTALHMQILREKGPCPVHRRSFLKFLNDDL